MITLYWIGLAAVGAFNLITSVSLSASFKFIDAIFAMIVVNSLLFLAEIHIRKLEDLRWFRWVRMITLIAFFIMFIIWGVDRYLM